MATLLILGGSLVAASGLGATLFGFGAAGVAAGSLAAATQATVGNVAPGSIFALLTSWGMTGTLTTTAAGGGATAIAGAIAALL